jgi:hypothetical protein
VHGAIGSYFGNLDQPDQVSAWDWFELKAKLVREFFKLRSG